MSDVIELSCNEVLDGGCGVEPSSDVYYIKITACGLNPVLALVLFYFPDAV